MTHRHGLIAYGTDTEVGPDEHFAYTREEIHAHAYSNKSQEDAVLKVANLLAKKLKDIQALVLSPASEGLE